MRRRTAGARRRFRDNERTGVRAHAAAAALGRSAFAEARARYEQSLAYAPERPDLWCALAAACGGLGDRTGQAAALQRALRLDPANLDALLMMADHHQRGGDNRAAVAYFQAALARAPADGVLTAPARQALARARRAIAEHQSEFERRVLEAVAAAAPAGAATSPRFALALDLLLGRKRVFLKEPSAFYFPELPQRQFYERDEFPWLAALEARTEAIRDELEAVLRDSRGSRPYVKSSAARPPKAFGGLADNPDWSAFFIIEDGMTVPEAASRCPQTMQALAETPLAWVPGRMPSVLFSLLAPRTRIPPHHGLINTRLICHLPLIVPPGCGLRVGAQTRSWKLGETLIFDDSVEHEAWNDSGELRAVLLFEIWRPELDETERTLVSALLQSVISLGEKRAP